MDLFHYTCAHSAPGIDRDRVLRPGPAVVLPVGLVWCTDLGPDLLVPEAVGLTSHLVGCDRTEVGYRVDPQGVEPWAEWRRGWVRSQLTVLGTREWREARAAVLRLESAHNAMPRHWWVSETTVRVVERLDMRAARAVSSG